MDFPCFPACKSRRRRRRPFLNVPRREQKAAHALQHLPEQTSSGPHGVHVLFSHALCVRVPCFSARPSRMAGQKKPREPPIQSQSLLSPPGLPGALAEPRVQAERYVARDAMGVGRSRGWRGKRGSRDRPPPQREEKKSGRRTRPSGGAANVEPRRTMNGCAQACCRLEACPDGKLGRDQQGVPA